MYLTGKIMIPIEPQKVLEAISKAFNIPENEILRNTKEKPYPELKRIYYYLLSVNSNLSLEDIASTTAQTRANVSAAIKRFNMDIRINDDFKEIFLQVNEYLPDNYKVYLIN